MEVRMEYMMPREIDEAMARCPAMYLPLGTIEWHGVHNVAGVDAVKAHELCVRAAQQGGGLVHPPVYGGVGGLTEPHTFIMDEDASMHSVRLRLWLEQLCIEARRNGFKAILIVTGHYGATQQMTVRETAIRMTKTLAIPVLGTPEYFLALDKEYYGDHAAFFETSIMMHLFPDKVDLSRLGEEPHRGVGGKDPKAFATAEAGQVFCDAIIGRLAALAAAMPGWDDATRARFARAEDALVSRQIDLAAGGQTVWAAWRRIGEGVFNDYPELLASGRFEEIVKLVEAL